MGLLKIVTKAAEGAVIVAGSLGGGYYGYGILSPKYYSTYNTLFKAGQVVSAANTTASVFSDVDQTIRTENFNKTNATIQAVSKTTDNAVAFVAENTAPKIKITGIEGDGKKAKVSIEAGTNIGLVKGEQLMVIQIVNKTIGTFASKERKELGKIEVTDVIDQASYCSFEDGRSDIMKAFKETPNDIFVVTQLKSPEKNNNP